MEKMISRRKAIANALMASLAVLLTLGCTGAAKENKAQEQDTVAAEMPFRISLNTSTLMAYELPVDQQIKLVSEAGFDGIEIWMRDIMAYIEAGGSPAELKSQLENSKLVLENIIGFSNWCSDDAGVRAEAISQIREEMEIIAQMGGKFIAAPVMGIDSLDRTKLDDYANRYRAILEVGDETGVVPVLEIWGMGSLNKVADATHILIGSGHPSATLLLDFYHVYRGGNNWETADCINGDRLPVIHMNDYPATPAREELTDAHRLLPGEGICNYDEIIPRLYDAGFRGGFSVELFNREYWASMDAETMLAQSYQKTVEVVEKAMGMNNP
jgi:2-keto-myo-inositol isomerase